MDPRLGEGLDWFTRLLQNRNEKPQTLTDRLKNLRQHQRDAGPSVRGVLP